MRCRTVSPKYKDEKDGDLICRNSQLSHPSDSNWSNVLIREQTKQALNCFKLLGTVSTDMIGFCLKISSQLQRETIMTETQDSRYMIISWKTLAGQERTLRRAWRRAQFPGNPPVWTLPCLVSAACSASSALAPPNPPANIWFRLRKIFQLVLLTFRPSSVAATRMRLSSVRHSPGTSISM